MAGSKDKHEPAARRSADATLLADFAWSDAVVGMGFFPEEVGLPASWTWEANRVRQ